MKPIIYGLALALVVGTLVDGWNNMTLSHLAVVFLSAAAMVAVVNVP